MPIVHSNLSILMEVDIYPYCPITLQRADLIFTPLPFVTRTSWDMLRGRNSPRGAGNVVNS